MTNDLLHILSEQTHGRIIGRQSTFWKLDLPGSVSCRIHFQGKREFHYSSEEFHGLTLHAEHPLLMDYLEEWRDVYFSSSVPHPDPLIEKLSNAVEEITEDWRTIERYLNPDVDARSLLQSGGGQLLAGPQTIVQGLIPILDESGVTTSVLRSRRVSGSPQVLILGSSFVVADTFRVENRPSHTE